MTWSCAFISSTFAHNYQQTRGQRSNKQGYGELDVTVGLRPNQRPVQTSRALVWTGLLVRGLPGSSPPAACSWTPLYWTHSDGSPGPRNTSTLYWGNWRIWGGETNNDDNIQLWPPPHTHPAPPSSLPWAVRYVWVTLSLSEVITLKLEEKMTSHRVTGHTEVTGGQSRSQEVTGGQIWNHMNTTEATEVELSRGDKQQLSIKNRS